MSEISDMLADALGGSGGGVITVEDGDPAVLDASVAVLVGDCLRVDRTAELLRRSRATSPVTVLWQLDSLPPPSVDDDVIEAGYRAMRRDRSLRLTNGRMGRIARPLIPSAVRRSVRRTSIRWSGRSPVSPREEATLGLTAGEGPYFAMARLARLDWIEQAVRDGWLDHVLVSAPERALVLSARGVGVTFLPVGYHPWMGENLGTERDLEVLFLGQHAGSNQRASHLRSLQAELGARGVSLSLHSAAFGGERAALLNRAKISLNIHRTSDFWELSRIRLFISMACGVLVVSEPADDTAPFVPGRHFVVATVSEMPDVITHYLTHEDERLAIAQTASDLITTDMTMSRVAATMRAIWTGPATACVAGER
jgi:hypothetical protein